MSAVSPIVVEKVEKIVHEHGVEDVIASLEALVATEASSVRTGSMAEHDKKLVAGLLDAVVEGLSQARMDYYVSTK